MTIHHLIANRLGSRFILVRYLGRFDCSNSRYYGWNCLRQKCNDYGVIH